MMWLAVKMLNSFRNIVIAINTRLVPVSVMLWCSIAFIYLFFPLIIKNAALHYASSKSWFAKTKFLTVALLLPLLT